MISGLFTQDQVSTLEFLMSKIVKPYLSQNEVKFIELEFYTPIPGFGAQLIGPIQLHVKRQNSSIWKFLQDIAWTFFCLWVARPVIYLSKKWKDNLPW